VDEEEKKSGITQIPLLNDIVFDSSLPLRPPKKPSPRKKRANYSPDYDPDTMDLFGDHDQDLPLDDETTDELMASAGEMIDDLVEEFTEEISKRLREELTDQLASILTDLRQQDSDT
jgi:hypothetical protein